MNHYNNVNVEQYNDGGMIAHKYHIEYILNEGIDGVSIFSPVLVIDD